MTNCVREAENVDMAMYIKKLEFVWNGVLKPGKVREFRFLNMVDILFNSCWENLLRGEQWCHILLQNLENSLLWKWANLRYIFVMTKINSILCCCVKIYPLRPRTVSFLLLYFPKSPSFLSDASLLILAAVAGERSYRCDCGKEYSHQASLYNHKTYSCGKPAQFPCTFCPYASKYKGNLKKHMVLTHVNTNTIVK